MLLSCKRPPNTSIEVWEDNRNWLYLGILTIPNPIGTDLILEKIPDK